ncbi:MAG: hypothetical protein KDK70_16505 [Myxococcales bacterium]|nr:hypothetical protein [Myxococcales bacterium]
MSIWLAISWLPVLLACSVCETDCEAHCEDCVPECLEPCEEQCRGPDCPRRCRRACARRCHDCQGFCRRRLACPGPVRTRAPASTMRR